MIVDDILAVLPELQAQAESLMTDACVIERLTTGSDDDGFTVTTREPVWSGVCKLQTFEPYEKTALVGEGTRIVQRYSLHIPVGVGGVEVGLTSRVVRDFKANTLAEFEAAAASKGYRTFRIAGLNEKTHQTAQRLLADEQTGGIK